MALSYYTKSSQVYSSGQVIFLKIIAYSTDSNGKMQMPPERTIQSLEGWFASVRTLIKVEKPNIAYLCILILLAYEQ